MEVTLLSFLFFLEFTVFMVCFVFILVMGNALQPLRYRALAVLLMILTIGLCILAVSWKSLLEAPGLIEYQMGPDGISFRNSLTWVQKKAIYFMVYYNYSALPALLRKPTTFIRWREVKSTEVDEGGLWIQVNINPASQPPIYAVWPDILLVCTPENFLKARRAVEKFFAKADSADSIVGNDRGRPGVGAHPDTSYMTPAQ